MINILNRRELITSFDLEIINDAKKALGNQGIKYQTVSKSHYALFTRGATGTQSPTGSKDIQYYLYVHKKDLESARLLI